MGLWVLLHTSRLRAALGRSRGREILSQMGLPPTAMGQGRVETHMGFTSDSWERVPGSRRYGTACSTPPPPLPHHPVSCLLGRLQSIRLLQYLLFGPPHLGRTAFWVFTHWGGGVGRGTLPTPFS